MTARRSQIWVALVFAIYLIFQVRFWVDSLDLQLHATERAADPFSLKSPGGTITALSSAAKAAGISEGDRPVSINGQPALGIAPISRATTHLRAGDTLAIVVVHNGTPLSVSVPLEPTSAKPTSAQTWVLISFLYYLTPLFCMTLGFMVAFLRPRDLLAWLLLLLMLSFAEIAQGQGFQSIAAGWGPVMEQPAMFLHGILNGSWGLWMMLFGQYFPDRISTGWWNRLARWVLGLPIAVLTILAAVSGPVILEHATAMSGLLVQINRLAPLLLGLMMCAIGLFFANIFVKLSSAKTADDRRRLKMLYFGATVALTPLFLVVVLALTPWKAWARNEWILFPALFLLSVFPLTLAYVIVVEKAMELTVAIRQGLQYALARRGVRALMVIVMMAIIIGAYLIIVNPNVRTPLKIATLGITVGIGIRLRQALDRVRNWIDKRFFREAVNTERVLQELGEKVRTIVELEPLLATVTNTISTTLHVPRVALMTLQNGDFTPAHALGYAEPGPQVKFSASTGVAERLAKSREPLRVSKAHPEPWMDKNIEALGTELVLPLSVKDRLLGFLSLGPKLSEEPYTPTDVALLESVASQTGMAMENSRLTEAVASEVANRERLNRELEIAREVQQRLFPQSGPQVAGLEYAGKCRPASSVGGDYYDFVEMGDGRLGIAIGDISGKGIPAALLMASLQASLRGLAIANPPELSRLMENLNRLIYDASPSNRYATFFYGVYNAVTREFMYVNGGHNPPMIFRGGDVLRLEEGGPVVGLFGPATYAQGIIFLEPGDTMVLFTDGVSEAMNNEEEEFDEERLIAAVRSGAGMTPIEMIDHVMINCDAFAAGAAQHDDMTLVVVKVQ